MANGKNEMNGAGLVYFPAAVRVVPAETRALPEGLEEEPFVFEAEASNNSLDSYYTHMTAATLRNYARDGRKGVQFLDSHENYNLGYGRSFAGRFEEDTERKPVWELVDRLGDAPSGLEFAVAPPDTLQRAVLDIFTVPGIRFGGSLTYGSTDDFIRAVRSGLVRSVSVGFLGGRYTCDICGGNYYDVRECRHFAGLVYEAGEQGDRSVLATFAIDGAGLRELSAVYSGATPEAMITKAERLIQAGELPEEKAAVIEQRYRVELPRRIVSAGVDVTPDGVIGGDRVTDDILEAMREMLAEAGLTAEIEEPSDAAEAVRVLVGQAEELTAENERLTPLAEDGRQYRADLVSAALAEGVRAYGSKFDAAPYRALLEEAPIATIKRFTADWKAIGDKRFPGGPHVNDEKPERAGDGEERPQVVPDSHYAS